MACCRPTWHGRTAARIPAVMKPLRPRGASWALVTNCVPPSVELHTRPHGPSSGAMKAPRSSAKEASLDAIVFTPHCLPATGTLAVISWDVGGRIVGLSRSHDGTLAVMSWDSRGHIMGLTRSLRGHMAVHQTADDRSRE